MTNFFRQEVLDLPAYHLEAHEGIKLNQNESPWDIPVELKAQVVENLLRLPWNRYPLDDQLLLKKKMAKLLEVWPDNLVFANGSNVLIQALTFATSVQQEVMILDPTFGVFEIEARLFANQVTRIPLNDDFSIPKDKILKAIKRRPSLIFIPNPNAPTGNLFDPDVLRKIIETADCLVVIDEAYYPFSGFTVLDWVKEYDNLVVLRTFSKAFALGGLRLGWMIADPEAARQVQKCLLPFCISRLVMSAMLAVIEQPGYVKRYVKQISDERDRVYKALAKMSELTVYPSRANFILFEVDEPSQIFKKLLEEK
ncbi:MAG: aminotransferase class I/II-fold pyridoxal phosphate-dependent enzyme, partial [Deltaproteobacteria bacterium]|nr:aminotransferase class I/II-fold pyridoxal phosphate-dependent enzyme [Deltaproteobacteria bacterium]